MVLGYIELIIERLCLSVSDLVTFVYLFYVDLYEYWVRVDSNLIHGCVQRRTKRKLLNIEK